MPAVITFGEALVDFTAREAGIPLEEASSFDRAAGGAPANVAVGVCRLGGSAGFVGAVGEDFFGRFLVRTLREHGVDTTGVTWTREARTGLAFIALDPEGEREFAFYRHPGADQMVRPEDLDPSLLAGARVFHFGSLSLTGEPAASAARAWIRTARRQNLKISFDPNLRPSLWTDPGQAADTILKAAGQADWIKLSEEEYCFLTGSSPDWTHPEAVRAFLWRLIPGEPELVVVTRGRGGSVALTPDFTLTQSAFPVETVDTTGAGDAFTAGLLTELTSAPGNTLDPDLLGAALRTASAAGALTAAGRGVIPSLPTRAEVDNLLSS